MKNLDYEDWEEIYQPVKEEQGLKDFHPTVINEKDRDILSDSIKTNQVWTLVDTDNDLYIISGFHFVNRIDVYITKVPFEKGEEIEVKY